MQVAVDGVHSFSIIHAVGCVEEACSACISTLHATHPKQPSTSWIRADFTIHPLILGPCNLMGMRTYRESAALHPYCKEKADKRYIWALNPLYSQEIGGSPSKAGMRIPDVTRQTFRDSIQHLKWAKLPGVHCLSFGNVPILVCSCCLGRWGAESYCSFACQLYSSRLSTLLSFILLSSALHLTCLKQHARMQTNAPHMKTSAQMCICQQPAFKGVHGFPTCSKHSYVQMRS